jgi:hypothetical protein
MARKKTVVESVVAEVEVAEVEVIEVDEQDEQETKQSAAEQAALQSLVWTNITSVVCMFVESEEISVGTGESDIVWSAEVPKDNRLPIHLRASKPWVKDDDQTLVECVVTVDARQANPCRIEWFVPHLRLKTLSVVESMAIATQQMAMVTKFLTDAAEKAEIAHANGDATEDE